MTYSRTPGAAGYPDWVSRPDGLQTGQGPPEVVTMWLIEKLVTTEGGEGELTARGPTEDGEYQPLKY